MKLTRSEIIEQYWYEFLQYTAQDTVGERVYARMVAEHDWEYAFWSWFCTTKMESTHASPAN